MVTSEEAIRIAAEVIRQYLGRSLRVYGAVFRSAESQKETARSVGMAEGAMAFRSFWAVNFENTILGPDGTYSVTDGGPYVEVDAETGKATLAHGL
jgi:hypothetical protein